MKPRTRHLFRVTTTWPSGRVQTRCYLTESAANYRRERDENQGATATIAQSNPVTWPDQT